MKEEGDDDNAFYDVLPLSEVEEAGSTNPRQRCSKEFLFRCSQESARSLHPLLQPPAHFGAKNSCFLSSSFRLRSHNADVYAAVCACSVVLPIPQATELSSRSRDGGIICKRPSICRATDCSLDDTGIIHKCILSELSPTPCKLLFQRFECSKC